MHPQQLVSSYCGPAGAELPSCGGLGATWRFCFCRTLGRTVVSPPPAWAVLRVGERGSTAWIEGVPEQGLPLLQDEPMMATVVGGGDLKVGTWLGRGKRQKTTRWLGTQVQITEKLEKFRSGELFGFRDFCVYILIAPTRRSGCTHRNRCGGFLL